MHRMHSTTNVITIAHAKVGGVGKERKNIPLSSLFEGIGETSFVIHEKESRAKAPQTPQDGQNSLSQHDTAELLIPR